MTEPIGPADDEQQPAGEWPACAPQDDAEQDEDQAHDGEAGEESRRRALAMPDLRPYTDPRPLAELGPLAVEAGRTIWPPLRHRLTVLARLLAVPARGLLALLAVLAGWLSGKVGKRGTFGVRLGVAVVTTYAVVQLVLTQPAAPWGIGALVLAAAVLAGTGRLPLPASGRKGKAPGKAPAAEPAAEKETGYGRPRRNLVRRLGRRPLAATPDPAPSTPRPGPPEHATEQADSTPGDDPLTALIRAEIGAEAGVHLSVLRPAMRARLPGLSQATDKQLREHLLAAGWDPSRKLRARGVAGRAGVHRDQLPPLHSPGTGAASSPDHSPPAGDSPPPAEISAPLRTGERPGEWSREDLQRGIRSVPDPDRGPGAWKIEHYGR